MVFAFNGLEALGVIKKHGDIIDLILVDVMMDRMDGYRFMEELIVQQYGIPVFFLTAKSILMTGAKGWNIPWPWIISPSRLI